MNAKGLQSYCQECGACSVNLGNASTCSQVPKSDDALLVDRIVNEVLKEIGITTTDAPLPGIPLGVSNHHTHLTEKTFKLLFGQDAEPEVYRELYQPDEYAAKQMITIAGPKQRTIQNVRLLGPLRSYDQVELSLTDAIILGIQPPVVNSGNLTDAAPLTLIGPAASVYLEHCAIIANRHIHMPPSEAKRYGVKDGDFCKIGIGGIKSTIFENVLIRVKEGWKLQAHLDTDDANAANVRCSMEVTFLGKM
jgi:putative phosphotransacetylase